MIVSMQKNINNNISKNNYNNNKYFSYILWLENVNNCSYGLLSSRCDVIIWTKVILLWVYANDKLYISLNLEL